MKTFYHKMLSRGTRTRKFFSYESLFAIEAIMDKKKKYYAIAKGHKPGIYDNWFGETGAKANIDGFSNAVFKKFSTLEDAASWLNQMAGKNKDSTTGNQTNSLTSTKNDQPTKTRTLKSKKSIPLISSEEKLCLISGQVIIYTDGGCLNNPGPGGYGAVLKFNDCRKEISGGYRRTTNNRMELMACIEGLRTLKKPCRVVIYSDSMYVVNAIEKGWVQKWRSNGWMRTKTESAENVDLWEKLLELCSKHKVEFKWVRGHAGNLENERCDELARQNALQPNLPRDTAYESGKTKAMVPSEFFKSPKI
jgi:ribonuclease HI